MKEISLYLKVLAHRIIEYIICLRGGVTAPMLKRKTVAKYAEKFNCNIFVETGTYLGEMVEYQEKNFQTIYSIEIADVFYKFSSDRLKKKKNIHIKKGNSGVVLKDIVSLLTPADRVLFWLDGHYSGGLTGKGEKECPVIEELECIFSVRGGKDVILIDDARCFNGTGDYPTLEVLEEYIRNYYGNAKIKVKNDMIRIFF